MIRTLFYVVCGSTLFTATCLGSPLLEETDEQTLIRSLLHGNEQERRQAARTIRELESTSDAISEALCIGLCDGCAIVRWEVVKSAGVIGKKGDKRLIARLSMCVHDRDSGVRSLALQTLGVIDVERTQLLDQCILALKTDEVRLAKVATEQLAMCGAAAARAIPEMIKLFHKSNLERSLQLSIVGSVGSISSEDAHTISFLQSVLDHKSPTFRAEAIRSLAACCSVRNRGQIQKLIHRSMNDRDERVAELARRLYDRISID